MALPQLDSLTVFVVSAMVIAFSGFVLILARGRDGGAVPLVFWGSAMVMGAVGIVLLALAPFTDAPARACGNIAVLIGAALSWTGAREFAGRHFRPVVTVAGAAVWLVAYSLPWGDGDGLHGTFGFLVGSTYILATAAELWRGRDELLPTRNAAVIFLLVHAAVYLIQAGGTLALPAIFSSDRVLLFLMLEALLHTTGMAFLFLALMKERAELRSTLRFRRLAMFDGLTGLGNRRHFDLALKDQLRRAARVDAAVGLLMIDVDHFKAYNDTYGHQAGDDCLRTLATTMNATVHRAGDLALRYGGEEFAVLLPGTDEAGATTVAEQIRTHIHALGIEHPGSTHGMVTVSIGVACLVPAKGADQSGVLLQAADRALYEAKDSGRNATRYATAEPFPIPLSLSGRGPG